MPAVNIRALRFISLAAAFMALALTASGCGFRQAQRSDIGPAVVLAAKDYLGTPYAFGGKSRRGLDCSGLTLLVYHDFGVELPAGSYKQAKVGVAVDRGDLQPGDLVFFHSRGRVNHVGIYAGRNRMIHAPGKGRGVEYVDLDVDYFRTHYHSARRIYASF